MLCNRPNEPKIAKAQPTDSQGNLPFNSRVNPEATNWQSIKRVLPKREKKKKTNAVL